MEGGSISAAGMILEGSGIQKFRKHNKKAEAVPLPVLPVGAGREAENAGMNVGPGGVGGEIETNSRPSLPDEKDAASTLALLFSTGSSSSPPSAVLAARVAEGPDQVRGANEDDEEMEEKDQEDSTGGSLDGERKASAAGVKRDSASEGKAPSSASDPPNKKPHAMVDHTYTDYSVVDEDLLAEIDRREKVLSDAGDVLKFIKEAERSVWTRDSGGLRPARRVLSEAEEQERREKTDKLQQMVHEKNGGARRNSGGVAQPFPLKLMEVLGQEEYSHIASWMPHGRAFIVHNPKAFTAEILPRFFKQTKYMSFTRQLNLWGFKRITRRGNPDAGAYYHELFLRGRPRLSTRMRREKIKGTGIKLSPNPDAEPDFYKMAKERPLLTPAEESEQAAAQAAAAAAEASIGSPSAVVPSLPSFPGAATGVPSLASSLRSTAELLHQRNDLTQLRLMGQMKALEAAREEQRKTTTERAAVEYAAAFAAKQQQQAAAAAALAARAAQHPQDATAILSQLMALNGSQAQAHLASAASAPAPSIAPGNDFCSRMNAAMNFGISPVAGLQKQQQQQPNRQELLRSLQLQNDAQRRLLSAPNAMATDALFLGRTSADAGPNNGDALAALAAQMSGGGGAGGMNPSTLLASPDPILSTVPASPAARAGASSASLPNATEAALLRNLLLEQKQKQQQQQQGSGGRPTPSMPPPPPPLASSLGGGGAGGGALPDILAAVRDGTSPREELGEGGGVGVGGGAPSTAEAWSAMLGSGSLTPQQMAKRLNAMSGTGLQGV